MLGLVSLCVFFVLCASQSVPAIDVSGIPGTAYQYLKPRWQLRAVGGVPPYTFSAFPGLEAVSGLTLDSSTGIISGEIFSTGKFPFVFTVKDAVGNVASSPMRYLVIGGSDLVMTLFEGHFQCEIGVFCVVSQQVSLGSNPALVFSNFKGRLPPGLSWNQSTGQVSGIPGGNPQSYSLFQNCRVGSGSFTVGIWFYIEVVAPFKLDSLWLQPTCDVGFPFNSQLRWKGGPSLVSVAGLPEASVFVNVTAGSFPPGVSLRLPPSTSGSFAVPFLTGVPTTPGPFDVTLTMRDYLGGVSSFRYQGLITSPPSLIVPSPVFIGEVGVTHVTNFSQNGGLAPKYWFGVGGLPGTMGCANLLPPGVSIANSPAGDGSLTGIPIKPGSYSFSVTLQPFFVPNGTEVVPIGQLTGSQTLRFDVFPQLSLPPSFRTQGQVGKGSNISFVISGGVPGPLTFSVSSGTLPPGLSLDSAAGVLVGVPTQSGTFIFAVDVTDSLGAKATTRAEVTVSNSDALSPGAIAGIAVGISVALALATLVAIIAYKRWNASLANVSNGSEYESFDSAYKF